MNNSNQNLTLEILLQSLENDFDQAERARIFQNLKEAEVNDDALLGAKMILEANNWDYKALKAAFAKTESKIDAIASRKVKKRQSKPNYFKYAAVFIPFVAIAGYLLMNNSKSIDDFYTKEQGLPNLMSTESKTEWNDLMQLYKANELNKAYILSLKIEQSKKENDTLNYYKAVIAYELKKYAVANGSFSNLLLNKKSTFYYDAEFRLGFSLLKSGNKNAAKQQFEKVKLDLENPYQSDAELILKELF